jgi:cation transport ATPase
VGEDTTIGKVTPAHREAEETRTPRQLLIEQVARSSCPVALSVAAVTWFIMSQNPDEASKAEAGLTAITVLIVACPSVAAAGQPERDGRGVRRRRPPGHPHQADPTISRPRRTSTPSCMDKTGTITTGKFEVSRLAPARASTGAELLSGRRQRRAALQPPARAIDPRDRTGRRGSTSTAPTTRGDPRARRAGPHQHGRASASGAQPGSASSAPPSRADIEAVEQKIEGMTGVHVMRDGRYLGAVGLEDKVRPEHQGVIQRLRDLGVRTSRSSPATG